MAGELQVAATIMVRLMGRYGLMLRVEKTKSMSSCQRDANEVNISCLMNQPVEHVQSFKYLGSFKSDEEPRVNNREIN